MGQGSPPPLTPRPKVLWDRSLAISKSLELASTSVKRGTGVPSRRRVGSARAWGMGGRRSAGRPSRPLLRLLPGSLEGLWTQGSNPSPGSPDSRTPEQGMLDRERPPGRGCGGSCETLHCPLLRHFHSPPLPLGPARQGGRARPAPRSWAPSPESGSSQPRVRESYHLPPHPGGSLHRPEECGVGGAGHGAHPPTHAAFPELQSLSGGMPC